MKTSILHPKNISIAVHESIAVADVFGAVKSFVDKVLSVSHQAFKMIAAIVKIETQKILFAGLNNHSSPPGIVFNRLNTSKKIARF